MSQNATVRFEFLDALRGIAAIYVLFFHLARYNCGPQLVANGLLAVDFFFILSGLVIAAAYEHRFRDGMTFAGFVRVRAIRLLPMAMLSVVLGTSFIVLRHFIGDGPQDSMTGTIAAFVLNLFLIPKLWYENWSEYQIFPSNAALWSLFFEVSINLVWAFALVRASNRVLMTVVAIAAILLVSEIVRADSPNLGWSSLTLLDGFARVTFGFTVGVLIYRYHDKLKGPPLLCGALAFVLLTAATFFPLQSIAWWLPAILLMLPVAVASGAAAAGTGIMPAEQWLGRLSYPIYAIHMPIVHYLPGIQKRIFGEEDIGAPGLLWAFPIIAAAWLALRFYDEPVRAWLSRVTRKPAPEMVKGGH